MKFECDIQENLGKLPKTLEERYSQIYATICAESGSSSRVANIALMWIMCSPRPLTPEEWTDVTCYASQPLDSRIDLGTLLDICHNLVVLDWQSNAVRFAHLSVREYLEKYHFNIEESNVMAAKCCLSMLIDCEGLFPAASYHGCFRYSTINWAYHVDECCSGDKCGDILNLLRSFLGHPSKASKTYSNWLSGAKAIADKDHSRGNLKQSTLIMLYRIESVPLNPLFAAAYFRFGEKFQELWESDRFEIGCKNKVGETLLSIASDRGHIRTVRALLERMADVNNDSTSPAIDQSGPGPSKSSPIQSEKFLDRARTNPQFFGTWTALDQSIRAESGRIRWVLLIYLVNI